MPSPPPRSDGARAGHPDCGVYLQEISIQLLDRHQSDLSNYSAPFLLPRYVAGLPGTTFSGRRARALLVRCRQPGGHPVGLRPHVPEIRRWSFQLCNATLSWANQLGFLDHRADFEVDAKRPCRTGPVRAMCFRTTRNPAGNRGRLLLSDYTPPARHLSRKRARSKPLPGGIT